MRTSDNKIKKIVIITTVMITIIAWVLWSSFTHALGDYLIRIYKPMSEWGLAFPVFSLSVGMVPILSYLPWKKNPNRTFGLLLVYWIISWCMMIIICVFAFWIADIFGQPESLLLPEYIVWLPFTGYWNVVLPLASILTPVVQYQINKIKYT